MLVYILENLQFSIFQLEAEIKKLLGKPKTDEDNIVDGTTITESKS